MRSPLKQKPKKSTVSAHGQLDDAEREYQDDLAAYNKKKSKYWYKINGKPCTKAQYLAYKNKPGSDEPGKSTNDPDASGNKAKIAKDRAKVKGGVSPPLKMFKKRKARRAARYEKYGTKSRRKARKIEGTTRSQQKRLERLGTKASAKRTARNTKRYEGFTDAELMARKEQGSNYRKTPLDFKSPTKQTVNIPKRPGLEIKKNQNAKISQGTSKKSTTKKYSGPKVKAAEVPFYNAAKGALGYIKKKITPR